LIIEELKFAIRWRDWMATGRIDFATRLNGGASGATDADIVRAQDRIRAGSWRLDQRTVTEPWVGVPIAEVLDVDLRRAAVKRAIAKLVKKWLAAACLGACPASTAFSRGGRRPSDPAGGRGGDRAGDQRRPGRQSLSKTVTSAPVL
jgi:hypothetical protein